MRLRRALPWMGAGYLIAAFTVTHLPIPPGTAKGLPHVDKLVHAAIFAGMSLLIAAWRTTRFDSIRRAAVIAFLFCLLYGAADEFTQSFLASRSSDWWDLLADAVGAAIGIAAFFLLIRWWRRTESDGD
ncbi:hypothetical protein LzC2_13790 [Planctomycetes bacterium LzC2]|uniref:VanZ-like domain-containing protein n=2 Tax=Alienimonas chondri TaxID=2681879 RepID=A0ABX1VC71_9PLAN|nr:hypothetical protein [Alienimonas chondri]